MDKTKPHKAYIFKARSKLSQSKHPWVILMPGMPPMHFATGKAALATYDKLNRRDK